jgi:hypothetical protein
MGLFVDLNEFCQFRSRKKSSHENWNEARRIAAVKRDAEEVS